MSYSDDHGSEITKLLRCKRYEQPPPGYFLNFSDKVMARIEAGEVAEYSSWWSWLVDRFDARPVLVCAYGLAVSSLLFIGFRLSQVFEAEVAAMPGVSGDWLASGPSSPLLPEGISHTEFAHPIATTSFSSSRLVFRDEASYVFPASSLRLQAPVFTLGGTH